MNSSMSKSSVMSGGDDLGVESGFLGPVDADHEPGLLVRGGGDRLPHTDRAGVDLDGLTGLPGDIRVDATAHDQRPGLAAGVEQVPGDVRVAAVGVAALHRQLDL